MTKLDAGLITSLPASDPGSAAVWGSKRINPRPQFCLCLAWSGCPSNDDDDDDDRALLLHTEVRWVSRGRILKRVFELREQIAFFLRQQNFGVLAKKFSQEEFITKFAYLADIFDSLNSLNLSMQGAADFTVTEQAAKVAAYHKKLALWKSYATRGKYDMFPERKHYLCKGDVNIEQTAIGHLEMLVQKFEDYYGEALTPNDENDWILNSFAGTDFLIYLPILQKSSWK